MKRTWTVLFVLVLAFAMVAAGCSEDEDEEGTGGDQEIAETVDGDAPNEGEAEVADTADTNDTTDNDAVEVSDQDDTTGGEEIGNEYEIEAPEEVESAQEEAQEETQTETQEESTTGCEQPATIQDVCGKVFECGGWGWNDQAECENGFIDNPEYQTECTNTDGYFCCVQSCLTLDCEAFSDCEAGCWDENCM